MTTYKGSFYLEEGGLYFTVGDFFKGNAYVCFKDPHFL